MLDGPTLVSTDPVVDAAHNPNTYTLGSTGVLGLGLVLKVINVRK